MNSPIKERPILFSAPMVRANRAGLKNQTRRVVKFPKGFFDEPVTSDDICIEYASKGHAGPGFYVWLVGKDGCDFLRCPYGKPGDRLWVRENFCTAGGVFLYHADIRYPENEHVQKWKPSIHMPRKACRNIYQVVNVRVERLQDITEADAIAEGLVSYPHDWRSMSHPMPNRAYEPYKGSPERFSCPVQAYQALWDSINGKRQGLAWADNPWVWAVSFKAVPHD